MELKLREETINFLDELSHVCKKYNVHLMANSESEVVATNHDGYFVITFMDLNNRKYRGIQETLFVTDYTENKED